MKYAWASAINLRFLLAVDHLALIVGWLLPAYTLIDSGREEGRGSKAKRSPRKLPHRFCAQINLKNALSKRNTTLLARL